MGRRRHLVDAGWSQNERIAHQWRRDGVSVDVVNATDDEIAYGVDLANQLHEAIDMRSVIRFRYDGKLRVAEPHVLGTKNGRVQLLVWQTGGASSSGQLPNWRRFDVRDIAALEVTAETFAGMRVTRGVRHSALDRHIAVVSR